MSTGLCKPGHSSCQTRSSPLCSVLELFCLGHQERNLPCISILQDKCAKMLLSSFSVMFYAWWVEKHAVFIPFKTKKWPGVGGEPYIYICICSFPCICVSLSLSKAIYLHLYLYVKGYNAVNLVAWQSPAIPLSLVYIWPSRIWHLFAMQKCKVSLCPSRNIYVNIGQLL